MNDLTNGLVQAIQLILSADPALVEIIILSLRVTGTALLISSVIGIPAGALLGLSRATADRYWHFARAWLYQKLESPPEQ